MNSFSFILLGFITLLLVSLADQRVEENLRHLVLPNKVRFSIGSVTSVTSFTKLEDMDQIKVDADLAKYKIKRVSDAFISKDGRYVLTFARDAETDVIKRILFFYEAGEVHGYADDVVDMSTVEIKTSKGSISVAEGFLISN